MRARLLLAVLAAAPLAGCGADAQPAHRLTVYAASSLREALTGLDQRPAYSFAGSNQLQLQIERGAPADVFASASPKEPQALFRAGRCTRPQAFATNRLVLLVPKGDPGHVGSVRGLRGGGQRIAVGNAGVPVGDYTRTVLARLHLGGILAGSAVSEEANAAGIVAKVASGSADAGFAYVTDAKAAAGRVEALPIPASAQPPVRYEVCAVVRKGADKAAAARWIARLRGPAGRATLQRFGFGLP